MKEKNIAVLGDGVTATSVRNALKRMGIHEVPIEHAERVITSPGIPSDQFPKTDAEIISEIEWSYRLLLAHPEPPTLIAITGTNGKSTVTSMLAHCLDCPATGNIGRPLIDMVHQETLPPRLVVEVSSYQLEQCTRFSPNIAIWLNVSNDHLERHHTLERYAMEKAKITLQQSQEDHLIYDSDDPIIARIVSQSRAKKHSYASGDNVYNYLITHGITGDHHIKNASAVFHCAKLFGMTPEATLKKITSFRPLPHRMEVVTSIQSRQFINDSKATNPHATHAAINSISKPITLILCGYDKGLRLDDFAATIADRINTVVIFGDIRHRLTPLLRKYASALELHECNDCQEAVLAAYTATPKDGCILFSPSCSSFDQFDNFESRGNIFKRHVETLKRNEEKTSN